MSIEIIARAWKCACESHTQKLTLIALADNANDQGTCYPSIAHIARKCDLTERAIQLQLRRMEEIGLIKTEVGGGRKASVYTVLPEGVLNFTEPTTPERRSPLNGVHPTPEPRSPQGGTAFTSGVNGVHPNRNGTVREPSMEPESKKAAGAAPSLPEPSKTNGRKRNGMPTLDDIISMLPEPLNTPGVRAALSDYVDSRKALRFPLTAGAASRTLADLKGFTALEAEAALSESVKRGWRGVFPKKLAAAKPASDDLIPSDQLTEAQKAENAKNGEDWKNNLW